MFESLSANGVVAAALIAPPGADVLTALAGVDVNSLPESAQVDLLIALDRQSAWLSAQLQLDPSRGPCPCPSWPGFGIETLVPVATATRRIVGE